MRNLIKIGGVMVVFGLLIFFGGQVLFTQETKPIRPTRPPRTQDTTLRVGSDSLTAQETYISAVVISAPWAKKNLVYDGEESPPGEFGVYQYVVPESLKQWVDAGKPEGPTSYTVAPNGDIYITDPLNERIQRFDANGNFVSVIPIPLPEWGEYVLELSDSAKVERLRRAGKLPKIHDQIPKEPNDVQEGPTTLNRYQNRYQYVWSLICVDQNNNVYLLWWEDYTEQTLCKYDQQGKLLATYTFFPEVRFKGGANCIAIPQTDYFSSMVEDSRTKSYSL
jgi:hypothetical protein